MVTNLNENHLSAFDLQMKTFSGYFTIPIWKSDAYAAVWKKFCTAVLLCAQLLSIIVVPALTAQLTASNIFSV